jgi:uncharacterized protein (DUF3820 family)
MESSNKELPLNSHVLVELANTRMPYGKYKGCFICDLPEPYLLWMKQKGFSQDKLGEQLSTVYEIKANGLGYLLKPLKNL